MCTFIKTKFPLAMRLCTLFWVTAAGCQCHSDAKQEA